MQALNLGSKLRVPGCSTRADLQVLPAPQQLRGGALKLLPSAARPFPRVDFFTARFVIGSRAAGGVVFGLCALKWKVPASCAWVGVGHILGLLKGRLFPWDLNSVVAHGVARGLLSDGQGWRVLGSLKLQ